MYQHLDGRLWTQIAEKDIDDWCNDFAHFTPNNGESLQQLFEHIEGWLNTRSIERACERDRTPILVVGHAGWINAVKILAASQDIPKLTAEWPRSINYQLCNRLDF
ncbi:histidine phosphatase family protein [Psychrobacter sp. DAB_AL32B]|uniref:histidine phosphatase family protein n=1 Tax=Psychrobacter sp. DAB_AL32B TaxID=1028414 RepID=UPI0013FDC80B|nr:histidine phosphatase family protein [Psychrobacter sp. DAB_AL32B]